MRYAEITRQIFVGPCPSVPEDFLSLKEQSVTAILSLLTPEDSQELEMAREETHASTAGLAYRNMPVIDFDDLDLKTKLPSCVEVLNSLLEAGHTVYVHCTAGVTRSPTVVAAYLHWRRHWPLDEALEQLQARRRCYPRGDLIEIAQPPQLPEESR